MGHCSRHWCICSGRRNCRMSETNRPGKTKQVYVRNNPAQISGCRSRKDTHDRGQSQYGYTAGEKLWFTDFVGRLRVPLTTKTRKWEVSQDPEERRLAADYYSDKLGDLLERLNKL